MKLLFIIGDAAVGKMTVWQELMKNNRFKALSQSYLRIDNSDIEPDKAARLIKETFNL